MKRPFRSRSALLAATLLAVLCGCGTSESPVGLPNVWDPAQVEKRTPSEWVAYFNRHGIEALKKGFTTEARREFLRAQHFDQANTASEYFLGVCSALEGAYEGALQRWEKQIEGAGFFGSRGKLKSAINMVRKAMEPSEKRDRSDPKQAILPPPPPRGLTEGQKSSLVNMFGPK